MLPDARKYFIALSFTFLFLALSSGPALSDLYTINAKDDAGQSPGQGAYAQLVYSDGTTSGFSAQPTSFSDVNGAAIKGNWSLFSAGNVWSADTTVGESIDLSAGMYRISVVDGGFTYDSFGWPGSEYSNKWLWGMNIKSQWTDGNGKTDGYDYWLGSGTMYGSAGDALNATLQGNGTAFVDIGLGGPGSLSFWINDWNSIDNGGSLTFSVTPVPESSTLPFLAGILLLLSVPRVRSYLVR